ncbi:MAG: hypothetical protein NC177_12065 [Ruminococcus flavefaciens]|nr:hypothetical protein [Ruminococcus flavefaciens]
MGNQNNKPIPYSFGMAVFIIAVLTLLDTVGCIVLAVGAYIFTKKGHSGLGIALVITNFIAPDMLPCVDEIFGVVAFVIPFMQNCKQGNNIIDSAKASVNSAKQYKQTGNDYIQKSEDVASKIGIPRNQNIDYNSDYYDDNNYYDRS